MPRRVDANQAEIVADLRAIGATVLHLHELGKGAPDILIGFRGANYLLEIKMKTAGILKVVITKSRLSPKQRDWHERWAGQVAVIWSIEEALDIMGVVSNAS